MKKAVAFLLAFLILLPALPTGRADFAGYADVEEDDWFADAVAFVSRYGYMNGTGEAQFAPYEGVTRGMVATILYRMQGEPETGANPFVDVPAGKWYSDAVSWAGNEGIVNGVGDGKFDPESAVTRQQMMTILYRYAMWKCWDIPVAGWRYAGLYPDPNTGEMTERLFSDGWRVSAYAREPMLWAVNRGVFVYRGDSGIPQMEPETEVYRAELAQTLKNLYDNVVNAEGEPGRELLSAGLYENEDGAKQVYLGAIHKDGSFFLSLNWVRLAGAESIAKAAGGRAEFDDGELAGYVEFLPDDKLTVTVTRGNGLIETGETFDAAFVPVEELTRRIVESLPQTEGNVWFNSDPETAANRCLTFGPDNTMELITTVNFQSDSGDFRMIREKRHYTSDGLDIFTIDGKKYRMDTEETAYMSLYIEALEGDPYGLGGVYTLEDAASVTYTDLPL